MGRLKAIAGHAAGVVADRSGDILKRSATDAPFFVERLYTLLNQACELKEAGKEIPEDVYKRIQDHLRRLDGDPSKYLKDPPLASDNQSDSNAQRPSAAPEAYSAFTGQLTILKRLSNQFATTQIDIDTLVAGRDIIDDWYLRQLGELPASFIVAARRIIPLMREQFASAKASVLSSGGPEMPHLAEMRAITQPLPVPLQLDAPRPDNYKEALSAFKTTILIPNISYAAVGSFVLAICTPIEARIQMQGTIARIVAASQGNLQTFRTQLFQAIDQSGAILLQRWYAKLAYYMMRPPIDFYIHHFISNISHSLESKFSRENFKTFLGSLISLFNSVLFRILKAQETIELNQKDLNLGKKYPGVLTGPSEESRLEAYFATPDISGLPRSETTNAEFAKSFIDAFTPRFPWRKTLQELPGTLQFQNRFLSWLNLPIYCITWLISLVAQIVVYFPEKLCNAISLWFFKRKAMTISNLRERLIPSAEAADSQSLLEGRYAHKLNLFILERAKVFLASLQNIKEDNVQEGARGTSIPSAIQDALRELITNGLTLLVKQDPAARYLLGSTPPVGVSLAMTLITDKIVTGLSPIFSQALQGNQVDEFLYTSLTKLNEAMFTAEHEVSDAEKTKVEEDMMLALKEIVDRITEYATSESRHTLIIQKRVHSALEHMQKETWAYIEKQKAGPTLDNWFQLKKTIEGILEKTKPLIPENTFSPLLKFADDWADFQVRIHKKLPAHTPIDDELSLLYCWADSLDPIRSIQSVVSASTPFLLESPDSSKALQVLFSRFSKIKRLIEEEKLEVSQKTQTALTAISDIYRDLATLLTPNSGQQSLTSEGFERIRSQAETLLGNLSQHSPQLEPINRIPIEIPWLPYIPLIKKAAAAAIPYIRPLITQVPNTFKRRYLVNLIIDSVMRFFIHGRVT